MGPTSDRESGFEKLARAGMALWFDGLSRKSLRSGRLPSLVEAGVVVGATTSPERLVHALHSDAYVPALATFAGERTSPQEILLSLMAGDARAACDVLRSVHQATGHRDGWVSVPLDPRLARDTGATLLAAKALHALVDRPNLLVAIPATHHGLPALRDAVTAGISVNATHVYSLDRFRAVQAAYVEGLERAEFAGIDLRTVGSFVSVPLAPVDTAFDALLEKVRDRGAAKLRGRVATAHAVLAYQAFEARMTLPRWRDLAASGALPQRPLWASTTADDGGARGRYVTELVAPGAAAAVTEETLAVLESGAEVRGDTIHAGYTVAQGVLDDVERLGISYQEVATALEDATLAEAVQAWDEILDRLSLARRV